MLAGWGGGLTGTQRRLENVLGLLRKQLNILGVVGGCSYLFGVPDGTRNNQI